ncbi:uncharacterized protein LOC126899250 isoform X8 [Daktulosphaira vitifoliae]|uniref:uncharacterized protein LOC126899250 isoform X4 n=1 Tax=Daktulosphaira vitifoliae TaxID=58002 RepID=UPI0021AAE5E7|nr:uncharacterized protein LOC126899250 isoform X4 [Daktulosphaira vitifoliae]XP_050529886.1 uncharacterized protein LOC126899250 isoform X5 [Daktulosphaira vitifoliae]XP_050529887.1 uncharacterized protein LOC126899250 isoform X6 [Daktulosphaira vitifoliae]XP_050529888.1 uncharacterized protein LOC126899250 isoform X7 [Daktulosphaira vitifoliae]XP_050529889.1 uncharacterized protein LOC126899250 isoform X8 [Daktulosphaira vitifoliae]
MYFKNLFIIFIFLWSHFESQFVVNAGNNKSGEKYKNYKRRLQTASCQEIIDVHNSNYSDYEDQRIMQEVERRTNQKSDKENSEQYRRMMANQSSETPLDKSPKTSLDKPWKKTTTQISDHNTEQEFLEKALLDMAIEDSKKEVTESSLKEFDEFAEELTTDDIEKESSKLDEEERRLHEAMERSLIENYKLPTDDFEEFTDAQVAIDDVETQENLKKAIEMSLKENENMTTKKTMDYIEDEKKLNEAIEKSLQENHKIPTDTLRDLTNIEKELLDLCLTELSQDGKNKLNEAIEISLKENHKISTDGPSEMTHLEKTLLDLCLKDSSLIGKKRVLELLKKISKSSKKNVHDTSSDESDAGEK